MITLYYLSSIILIYYELNWIIHPIEQTRIAQEYKEDSKKYKGVSWDEIPSDYKSNFFHLLPTVWVLIWLFIGLFTFQWVGFLFILLFNIVIIGPISKLTKNTIWYTILHWLNSVLGLAFVLFTIINHYHLRIDLTKIIISY